MPEPLIKTLVNHRLPGGNVTLGYYRPTPEALRAAAEKVGEFLLGRIGGTLAPRP